DDPGKSLDVLLPAQQLRRRPSDGGAQIEALGLVEPECAAAVNAQRLSTEQDASRLHALIRNSEVGAELNEARRSRCRGLARYQLLCVTFDCSQGIEHFEASVCQLDPPRAG